MYLSLKIDYIKIKLLHSIKMSLEKCFQKHIYMYNFFSLDSIYNVSTCSFHCSQITK